MNGRPALDRFLQTDPRDVGCAEAMNRQLMLSIRTWGSSCYPAAQGWTV
jgi:hypothetical protein